MKQKLKILYLIDTLETGGAEKSLVNMAIENKTVNSVFITLYEFKDKYLVDLLTNNGISVYQLNINKKYAFSSAQKKLFPLIQSIKPDIVHATLLRSELIARSLKRKFNYKLVGSFVSNSYGKEKYAKLNYKQKLFHYLFQQYNKITAPQVDLFISNSYSIKKANAKALSITPDKIKVIYRGRNIEKFETVSLAEIENFKKEWNIQNKNIWVSVGRLRKTKAFDDIIHAFSGIHHEFPDWILMIIGDGPEKKYLKDIIREKNLQNKIILAGNRNDVPVMLKAADAFVFASYLEGLPGSLIEAMFAKLPIVSSNIAENLECVDDTSALIFEKGNIKDLTEKMKMAMNREIDVRKLSQNAFDSAIKKFELKHIIEQYNQAYQSLILNPSK